MRRGMRRPNGGTAVLAAPGATGSGASTPKGSNEPHIQRIVDDILQVFIDDELRKVLRDLKERGQDIQAFARGFWAQVQASAGLEREIGIRLAQLQLARNAGLTAVADMVAARKKEVLQRAQEHGEQLPRDTIAALKQLVNRHFPEVKNGS